MPICGANINEVKFLYKEIFLDECYLRYGISLNKKSCVLDVGANVGFFTVFLNILHPEIEVYSFEPIPEVYEYLKKNRELYGIKGKAFNLAVFDQEKEIDFTYYPQVSIVSGISENKEQVKEVIRSYIKHSEEKELGQEGVESLLEVKLGSRRIKCKTKTISQIIAEERIENIDLLKVDVENSEHLVLDGILEDDWSKIKSLVIEIHNVDGRLDAIAKKLDQKGFKIHIEKEQSLGKDDILYNLFALRNEKAGGITSLGDKALLRSQTWVHPAEFGNHIKQEMERALPEYMIPSKIILLDKFLLTANGKIDRKALALLETGVLRQRGRHLSAPLRTATEETLAGDLAGAAGHRAGRHRG